MLCRGIKLGGYFYVFVINESLQRNFSIVAGWG